MKKYIVKPQGLRFFEKIQTDIEAGIEKKTSIAKELNPSESRLEGAFREAIKGIIKPLEDLEKITIFSPRPQQIKKRKKFTDERICSFHERVKVVQINSGEESVYLGYSKYKGNEYIVLFRALPNEKEQNLEGVKLPARDNKCITPELSFIFDRKLGKVLVEKAQTVEDLYCQNKIAQQLNDYLLGLGSSLFYKKEEKKISEETNAVSFFEQALSFFKDINWYKVKKIIFNWALDDAHKI